MPLLSPLRGFGPTSGGGTVQTYATPALTPSRLSSTSLSVLVEGDSGATYQVWAVGPGLAYQTLLGTTAGGGTVTATGLASSGDFLIWSAAFDLASGGVFVSGLGFAAVSLADLDSVLAAIRRTFAASPATQLALPGGLWANEVPEDVDMPYGYVELLGSSFLWTTEDFHVEVARVRMHLYAAGAENAERACLAVRALYDWRDLEMDANSTASTCQVMPTDALVQSEFARLKDGGVVYQSTVEYEVMVNRNTLGAP